MASASGNTVPVIARLVQTSEDRVREMIHRFDELGMVSLDPQWAGGRPRQITIDDEKFIVETANRVLKIGYRANSPIDLPGVMDRESGRNRRSSAPC